MHIILVGRPADRSRLRTAIEDAGIEIAGEFDTLADAHAASIRADAVVLAEDGGHRGQRDDDDWIAETLTPREIEVLELLAEGLPNKSIAERLGISDQTVKFHVSSICRKLGASNRTDAVRRGLRRGLISL